MRRGHAHSLSFERAFTLAVVIAGTAGLVASCGSISVVSDGGSGTGGNIDINTGTGGHVGTGGSGAGGSGSGGHVTGAGGATGTGGKVAGTGGAIGTGGVTGTGGMTTGMGGAPGIGGTPGTGGAPGTGGMIVAVDAGVDRGCICTDIVARVCGSDGMTYNNACLAACAGVTVSHTGACVACTAVRGCCSMDSDCNANEECAGTRSAPPTAAPMASARPARTATATAAGPTPTAPARTTTTPAPAPSSAPATPRCACVTCSGRATKSGERLPLTQLTGALTDSSWLCHAARSNRLVKQREIVARDLRACMRLGHRDDGLVSLGSRGRRGRNHQSGGGPPARGTRCRCVSRVPSRATAEGHTTSSSSDGARRTSARPVGTRRSGFCSTPSCTKTTLGSKRTTRP